MMATSPIWTLDSLLTDYTCESLPKLQLQGLSQDSRLVQSGDLYLALAGGTTHGMCFAEAAVAAGAVAVLCSRDVMSAHASTVDSLRAEQVPLVAIEDLDSHYVRLASRFYRQPDRALKLIAVTGTDGKTSVCRFIAQALTAIDQPCGYIGTLGWGLGEQLQSTELTTPDAVSLHRMLAVMRDQGARAVALEASSHGLAEGRLDGLALDVAVLTNFGRDHLDYHQSLEAYRAAKARLFSWPGLEAMVVNGRDSLGRELLTQGEGLAQFAFHGDASTEVSESAGRACIIRATNIRASDSGLHFSLAEGDAVGDVDTSLLGRFNVDNLLACYGCLRACGVAANQARHALASVTPVCGRMERLGHDNQPTVVIDFSHTPQALAVAIDAVRVHCRGSLWVVFGCGGDRDPGKRAPMAAAAEAADHVVLTDDNPRTERSEDIIADALQGFRQPEAVQVIADRAQAIAYAIAHAASDDLVLIAGKGHEDYQIIGTTRHSFSDRVEALAALEQAS
ncbi:UDP-N-acetylmuramoyl-L-alanyl-D-glutamate--2,6-diaminopimelate ligase [Granulosicoccus sp. 3-233]|uniref:UDP-N-acetylmuramoyl-L-alanyl-D-glutamate--2, 6-diaminopimelate ligase n=1 Tax=Granulosicoccus sp. 3-233 TaxID=3417969 RepID=UPI003D33902D